MEILGLKEYDCHSYLDYFDAAKKGNKTAQKELLKTLKFNSKPIIYSFYYRSRKLGINLIDLEDLSIEAFLICMNKFDDKIGDLDYYFKYIYSNLIKSKIRDKLSKTATLERNSIGYLNDSFSDGEEKMKRNWRMEERPQETRELVNLILKDKQVKLLNEEKQIIEFYVNDYNLKEISEILKDDYHHIIFRFSTAKKKIYSYLRKNYSNISSMNGCTF